MEEIFMLSRSIGEEFSLKERKKAHGGAHLSHKHEQVHRLEVGDGERYITTRGAAEFLGLSRSRAQGLAVELWPAVKFGCIWLVELDSVIAYSAVCQPRGCPLEPLGDKGRCYFLRQQEVLVTRAGLLTTAANLARSFDLTLGHVAELVRRGLPAQRIGKETLIYEDEWEEFVKHEWKRPRLKRPYRLPKPEGTILGPILPSPMLGLASGERAKGRFLGWTDEWSGRVEQGQSLPIRPPLTPASARKYGREPPPRVQRQPPPNPYGPIVNRDRVEVERCRYITTAKLAACLGLSKTQAHRLARERLPSIRICGCTLIPLNEVRRYKRAMERRIGNAKGGGYRDTRPLAMPHEEIETRPGILTTMGSLSKRSGMPVPTLYEKVHLGLPAFRVGKLHLIYEDDFERFTGRKLSE